MEMKDVMLKRSSVRNYKRQSISDEDINKILTMGMAAPVSFKHYDRIHFTVISDQTVLKRIISYVECGESPFYDAPVVILVSTLPDSVPYITALNIGCIVQNMLLAATDIGLGSVLLTKFLLSLQNECEILASLKIPDNYIPIAAVGIGYAGNETKAYNWNEVSKRVLTDWLRSE